MGQGLKRARAAARATRKVEENKERLTGAAIERGGKVHGAGVKSHWELRAALGDADPFNSQPGDIEGFWTSSGRFLSRDEAKEVATEAGQIGQHWKGAGRKLLSSDINW